MSSNTTCTGPLFDGRAARDASRAVEAIRHKLADEGARLATTALTASIRKHNTGRAIRGITQTDDSRAYQTGKYTMLVTASNDETIVTSDLATYGPWLEGTGSRNHTTRFKGYFSFRMAGQLLDSMAEAIAEETIAPYVREMQ